MGILGLAHGGSPWGLGRGSWRIALGLAHGGLPWRILGDGESLFSGVY